MKQLFVMVAMLSLLWACNNEKASDKTETRDSSAVAAGDNKVQKSGTVDQVVDKYLALKNALTTDDASTARNAAEEVKTAADNIDPTAFDSAQMNTYNQVIADIKEHADHIADNKSDIEHQREHFEYLSNDLLDLVKAVGVTKTLYRDFCPMYNNNKGASWLSETKEIKNPYLGKEMPKCGEVKEEIRPKA